MSREEIAPEYESKAEVKFPSKSFDKGLQNKNV